MKLHLSLLLCRRKTISFYYKKYGTAFRTDIAVQSVPEVSAMTVCASDDRPGLGSESRARTGGPARPLD
jgi:hypothetical protein